MPSITRRKRQREEEDSDQPRIYNWVGEGTIRDGAIHYKSLQIDDVIISIGDSAYIQGPSNSKHFICQIQDFFKNLFTGDKEARVQWYFRPEETKSYLRTKIQDQLPRIAPNEILYSDNKDLVAAKCIVGKASVSIDGINNNNDDSSGSESFFCRWFLHTKDGTITPVSLVKPVSPVAATPISESGIRKSVRRPCPLTVSKSPPKKVRKLVNAQTPRSTTKSNLQWQSLPGKLSNEQHSRSSKVKYEAIKRGSTHNSLSSVRKQSGSLNRTLSSEELNEMTPENDDLIINSKKELKQVRKNLGLDLVHDMLDNDSDCLCDHEGVESSDNEEEDPLPDKKKTKIICDVKEVIKRKPHKTRIRKTDLTPSIPVRQVKKTGQARRKSKSFELAKEKLHVSAVPETICCRENEFASICMFIEGKLLDGSGGCMYISGVPGTGKTATVYEVSRYLRNATVRRELPEFHFIELNGMRLTEPKQAYVAILKQLTGEKTSPNRAASILENYFSSIASKKKTKRKSVVILADELDMLWTRKQSILYNLFDWPTRPQAKLVVLAVANTMDLPERIMMNRVSSRLGFTRLIFQPYTFKQLQEIVSSRMLNLKVFEHDAILLAARKVAGVSGDARRALDICRRATEIAQEKSGHASRLVGMMDVNDATQGMFSSPMIMAVKNASFNQKLFLQAILVESKRTGMEETTLKEVTTQLRDLFQIQGFPPCTASEAAALCSQLASSRLILAERGKGDIHRRVRLNMSRDDVQLALRNIDAAIS